jgi:multidrug efflux pump subunit AcrA (membrane-fusion protein)
VQKEFDRDYVYVAHIDGDKTVAVQRDVLLGRSVSEFVEILSGLEAGEKIVVSGTENLENGSLVKIRN